MIKTKTFITVVYSVITLVFIILNITYGVFTNGTQFNKFNEPCTIQSTLFYYLWAFLSPWYIVLLHFMNSLLNKWNINNGKATYDLPGMTTESNSVHLYVLVCLIYLLCTIGILLLCILFTTTVVRCIPVFIFGCYLLLMCVICFLILLYCKLHKIKYEYVKLLLFNSLVGTLSFGSIILYISFLLRYTVSPNPLFIISITLAIFSFSFTIIYSNFSLLGEVPTVFQTWIKRLKTVSRRVKRDKRRTTGNVCENENNK